MARGYLIYNASLFSIAWSLALIYAWAKFKADAEQKQDGWLCGRLETRLLLNFWTTVNDA